MKHQILNYLLILFGIGRAEIELPTGCEHYYGSLGRKGYFHGVKCAIAGLGLESVKFKFPSNINYLEIEDDSIGTLNDESFVNYRQLEYISLRNAGIEVIEDGVFLPLNKLFHLDLSENSILQIPPLPSSIESLYLDSMKNRELFDSAQTFDSMAKLKFSLKILSAKNNKLEALPPFIRLLWRLKSLTLNANMIPRLSVDDVAPLCRLQELNFANNTIRKGERDVCDCYEFLKWTFEKRVHIRGVICSMSSAGMNEHLCSEKYGRDPTFRLPQYLECRAATFFWDYCTFVVCVLTAFFVCIVWFVGASCEKPFPTPKNVDKEGKNG